MIESIFINDINKLPCSNPEPHKITWLKKFTKGRTKLNAERLTFTDKINIIVGPNGSGKTTLLESIGNYFHATQGGYSLVTRLSVNKLIKNTSLTEVTYKDGMDIVSDGQIVFYNGGNVVGKTLDFNDDFIYNRLQRQIHKGSRGEESNMNMNYLLDNIEKHKDIQCSADFKSCNDLWNRFASNCLKIVDNKIPIGKPTIILDDIDLGMDLVNQSDTFRIVKALSNKFQILLSTHSLFPFVLFDQKDVNIIETKKGYYNKIKKSLGLT